jgi:RNA polymerase primary sigma factor
VRLCSEFESPAPDEARSLDGHRTSILLMALSLDRGPPGVRYRSERELVLAAKRGDAEARGALLLAFRPLIGTVARFYRRSSTIDRVELMQQGCVGLLDALERYDPGRGTPFWSYAGWWVRAAMQQLVAELTQPVVLSDRARRQLARIRRARQVHAAEHAAWPTVAELAGETGLPAEQVEQLLAVERVPRALDDAATLGDPAAGEALERVLASAERERALALLASLDHRAKDILHARYGLDGPAQTLREIADGIGVSPERVRQIEQQALGELREAFVRA